MKAALRMRPHLPQPIIPEAPADRRGGLVRRRRAGICSIGVAASKLLSRRRWMLGSDDGCGRRALVFAVMSGVSSGALAGG